MFYVTNQVMKFAPFGVFALIGVTVSTFGLASLIPLGKLLIVVYGAMMLLRRSCLRTYSENIWNQHFPIL